MIRPGWADFPCYGGDNRENKKFCGHPRPMFTTIILYIQFLADILRSNKTEPCAARNRVRWLSNRADNKGRNSDAAHGVIQRLREIGF